MSDDRHWARHQLQHELTQQDDVRKDSDAAFLFFSDRARIRPLDYETIMSLLITEWLQVQGAENRFKNERRREEDLIATRHNLKKAREFFDTLHADALKSYEAGIEDKTLPPGEVFIGLEIPRDYLRAYPRLKKEALALYGLTIEQLRRIDRVRDELIGRFANILSRHFGHSYDEHVAALIGPAVGWHRLDGKQVRNRLVSFRKKHALDHM